MAEPVSRQAWSRLVALLNAYVRDGGNAFSNSGPLWVENRWTFERCGLEISPDWSFPSRISRAMVKSMFEWSVNEQDLYRSFCAAMAWVSDRESHIHYRIKSLVSTENVQIGPALLELKANPSYETFLASQLSALGPTVGTSLINFLSPESPMTAMIDSAALAWMWDFDQVSESWYLDLQNFSIEQFERYSSWCSLVLNQFRKSGHLPEHCDDLAFIGYLMSADRTQSQLGDRFSEWVRHVG